MTGNLSTSGDIEGRDVSATRELNADGAAFLNSTLRVGGTCNMVSACTLDSTLNVKTYAL